MKWSTFDRAIAVWVCLLATSAMIVVLAGLSKIIGENSSNIASWVQAIGSILAILAGFYVGERTLRVQNEQQISRENEARRIRVRMQYVVLADAFEVAEAWGNEIARTIVDSRTSNLASSMHMGQSIINSLRAINNDQLPAVESVVRVNMVVLSVDIVMAGLTVLKTIAPEHDQSVREKIKDRAIRLAGIASFDRGFCNSEAEKISTSAEKALKKETEDRRKDALADLFKNSK